MSRGSALRVVALLGLAGVTAAGPALAAGRKPAPKPAGARRASSVAARPDAALYAEAKKAEARLRGSARLSARRNEWEAVVLAYRRIVGRYPRSGYCDNALLAVGDLYREMARRFKTPRHREEAIAAYRAVVAEYPSSSLGEQALFSALEVARAAGDRGTLLETARAYLDTYPEGRRAAKVKALLRRQEPSAPLPSPPPRGLASVFDLRAWSGDSSTRVVIDLERKVEIRSDRIENPDRLWIDLLGARLHPNLAQRVIPVGDGLLEQVRIGKNRDDVVRVVLDFKQVWEHQVFYLENPPRLVVDVRGESRPAPGAAPRPTGPPLASASGDAASSVVASSGPSADSEPTSPPGRPLDAVPSANSVAAGDRGSERRDPPPSPVPPAANRAGSYSLARQLGLGARRIVIDAGHGGHDPGAIGRGGLQEKDLVLDVALRLERLVRQELGTEVVLTRSSDVFVPLEERTAIANGQLANSHPADLFLSIHANSSRNPSAHGIETYFLNFARTAHAEAVAARENAISAATLKDLQGLVKAIATNSKIAESRDFAASVQEAMVRGGGAQRAGLDRGVHTAPLYVLIGANMPAVLAEIAFVSHPDEETRLKSGPYRETIARSLLAGVRSYLEALNRTQMRQLTDAAPRSTVALRDTAR